MTSKKRLPEEKADAVKCMKKKNVVANTVGRGKNIVEDDDDSCDEIVNNMQSLKIDWKDFQGLTMICGSCYIPRTNEFKLYGGDAHFIREDENTFGVADGFQSIDGGEYAREIMNNTVHAIENEPAGNVDPISVLRHAWLNTRCEGSSTACIVTLKGQCLHAVNVGNSGFMLFRDNKFVYRSGIQEHFLNTEYQLGDGFGSFKGVDVFNNVKIAVLPKDIIVAGTDGFFDNMHVTLIEEELRKANEGRVGSRGLAFKLAEIALFNSVENYPSSSSSRAERKGGNVDDITVVVGMII